MNKKKIIIITSIIAILLIIILFINLSKNPQKEIITYLQSIEFINKDTTNLYAKQISKNNLEKHNNNIQNNIESEYEVLYFNTDTYELTKNKTTYQDEITKDFTSTYNYTNNNLNYTYRINYNNTNIIMEGTYNINNKRFTCEPTFSYQIDIEKSKKDICNKIELEVELFSYETQTLFDNPKLLDYMKN